MTPRRIYGVETEYGLIARTRDDPDRPWRRLASDEAAQRLFAPLAEAHASTNAFLPGGGRLYLDIGSHPEYATPECTSARDLVVASRAGDTLLERLAQDAASAEAAKGRRTTFTLLRNNVDSYGNAWGSHENYLVARDLDVAALARWLVGFLVSRPLIGGAGRWHRGEFRLSQRADVLADVVSSNTTRSRPLINTRDEPHADPSRYRRLHVLAGDTLTLEEPMWLGVVATELVLRLAEAGGAPPAMPADPLAALRAWSRDPDAPLPTDDGSATTARDLQRACLERAERAASDEETRAGWERWRATLDALDAGRASCAEWDAKRRLLDAWRVARGRPADDPGLDALDLRWHALGIDDRGNPAGLARLLEARGRVSRLSSDADVAAAVDEAPSPGRARLRGRLLRAAGDAGRDAAADWASFVVHDLPDPDDQGMRRPAEVTLRLDDPFATDDPAVDALVDRMAVEPRIRRLGGFVPPVG